MSGLIEISGAEGVTLSLTADALQVKKNALAAAGRVTEVRDLATQTSATAALSEINRILKVLEASRTAVKRPVIELGRLIDSTAARFAEDLVFEGGRINDGIQSHYRREKDEADTARRMREALAAKRMESAAAESRAAEAEARRLEKEASAASSEEEARRLKAQSEDMARRAAEDRKRNEESASALKVVEAPAKSEKMSVRTVWKHRVADIAALYKSRPDLVAMSPLTGVINAEIRAGMRECQGLEIFEETDVTVRA